jgi:organic radical activating enzyme
MDTKLKSPTLPNNINGFHIEPTNICTLKCPGCARTRFIQQWGSRWKNHSIDIVTLMKFLDCDLKNKTVLLCGNYGDPIYHPEFHQLVAQLKQRACYITIITNGSHRSADWWHQLVSYLDCNDHVVFSVDGVPENFTQYRINADWDTIEQAMKICAASSVKTAWKYIPFSYNTNNIDQAQQLCESLHIDQFQIEPSDRFDEQTQWLLPSEELLGARYQPQQQWKQHSTDQSVQPKCADNQQHFISAEGYYVPCCYLQDHRFYYKTMFGKSKKLYDISTTTVSRILDQPATVEFYNNLSQQPGCQYNCANTQ